MTRKNKFCGDRFRRIIKMIKWWNHQHSSLMQSFHIEVLAMEAIPGPIDEYAWPTHCFFSRAAELTKTGLYHNGDRVDSYLDVGARRHEVLTRLNAARDASASAWYAARPNNNDHKTAIRLWGQIFRDKFPSYG